MRVMMMWPFFSPCLFLCVKQRKKSSNKWTCVVCNEKQSTRHVFAQGSMARDVRNFVQSFNMSRLFTDQKVDRNETLDLAEDSESGDQRENMKMKKKRTDWSEYVDHEPDIGDEIGDVNEPITVTELPKALFRKPKFSTYSPRLGSENGENGFKPVFSKRKSIDTSNTQDKEPSKYVPATVSKAPKWSDKTFEENKPPTCHWASKSKTYSAQENENNRTLNIVPNHHHSTPAKVLSKWSNYMLKNKSEDLCEIEAPFSFCRDAKAKGVSKWDEYITTEEDCDTPQPKCLRDISNRSKQQWDDDGIFDFSLIDERVEEDIHPDFK